MYHVNTFINTDKEVASYERRMSICLQSNGFSFSIITLDDTLMTFGEADFEFNLPFDQLVSSIKGFIVDNGLPTFGCKDVKLIAPSEHFVWIPEHLYEPLRDWQYIKTVSSFDNPKLSLFHAYSDTLKSYMVFSAPSDVAMAFKVAIPGIDIVNQHSILANKMLLNRSLQHPVLLMHVRNRVGDFDAFYNNQLLLSNSYAASNDDELLYHALDVMKKLHLETPDMELAICGLVGRDIYCRLQHYFPNVTLYTGRPLNYENSQFQTFHTYRHALLL